MSLALDSLPDLPLSLPDPSAGTSNCSVRIDSSSSPAAGFLSRTSLPAGVPPLSFWLLPGVRTKVSSESSSFSGSSCGAAAGAASATASGSGSSSDDPRP